MEAGIDQTEAPALPRAARRGVGRPRDPAADVAILKSALNLFIEHGFEGVSFDDIAESAGVAKTTIYRRWSSKHPLIADAIAAGRGAPELELTAGGLSEATLRERLVDALCQTLAAPTFRMLVARLVGAAADHPELMSVYWRVHMAPRRGAIVQVLERARAEGLIRPNANPEIVLDLISGALMHHLLMRPGERSADELRAYLLDVLGELGITESDRGENKAPRVEDPASVT